MSDNIPDKPYNNHQLTLLLIGIDKKLDNIQESVERYAAQDQKWRDRHVNDNKEEHTLLHERISSVKSYLMAVAVLSGGIGAGFGIGISYIAKFFGFKA